jgi:hypothetical protein
MMWSSFAHSGTDYDLSHLHPFVHTFVQPAKDSKPARTYSVQVIFSLHCFTHALKNSEDATGPLAYADSRETRSFDFARYEQSLLLPEMVRALPGSPCFHTGHGNFFTVRHLDAATGRESHYEIYFVASRSSSKAAPLNLFVQSAYVRDRAHGGKKPTKKIGIFVILHNTLKRQLIATPP